LSRVEEDGGSWLRRPKLYKSVVEPHKKKKKNKEKKKKKNLTHTLVHKIYVHEEFVLLCNLLHVRAGFGIRLLISGVFDIRRINHRNYSKFCSRNC
jgi:hypothetical protein